MDRIDVHAFPVKSALVSRPVEYGVELEDPRSGGQCLLNTVAHTIWTRCDGTNDADAIAAALAAQFDGDPADVARDVRIALAHFTDAGLIAFPSPPRATVDLLLTHVSRAIADSCGAAGPNLSGASGVSNASNMPGGSGNPNLAGDPNPLVHTAMRHGVIPLLWTGLRQDGTGDQHVSARVRRLADEAAQQSAFLLGESLDLLAALDAHGIRAVPLKGPVLGDALYGSCALRQSTDIDIAVKPDDLARAREVIEQQGYGFLPGSIADASAAAVARRPHGDVVVDLQWQFAPRRFRFPIELPVAWERLEPYPIAETTVWLPSPADYLLLLCAHGTKHCWGRLQWVADVAAFAHRFQATLDWDEALRRASRAGGERMLLLGLRLASDLLGAPIPEALRAGTEAARVRVLAAELRGRLFAPEHPTHFQGAYGILEGALFYMRTRERIGDRLPMTLHLAARPFRRVSALVTPIDEDRRVRLPRRFGFLYYFLRPLRLIRKHGARLARAAPGRSRAAGQPSDSGTPVASGR